MKQQSSSAEEAFPLAVVIPTYNRVDVLLRCLKHLETQTWSHFEVVIVDDGSTDDTRQQVQAYAAHSPLTLRYIHQNNSGPARARNLAARHLRSGICLLIGDDILAAPDLVRQHLAVHRERPADEVVALGHTRWSEEGQTVTPFMRWLDTDGLQFAYGDLLRGVPPSWRHFYTSNLSLKTAHLREYPFSEAFSKAAMEDMELGYRMTMHQALDMVFLPDAVAWHFHPMTVPQACRRMIGVGASSFLFETIWPEQRAPTTGNRLKQHAQKAILQRDWLMAKLRTAAALLTTFWCPNPLLRQVLGLHYLQGYREAMRCSLSTELQRPR